MVAINNLMALYIVSIVVGIWNMNEHMPKGLNIHSNHEVHYWILHKDGYHFCKCGKVK